MMKIIAISIWGLALSLGIMASEPCSPAYRLLNRLKKIQKKGIMIGHQDDPVYGRNWKWDRGRSDVKEVCGDYPAIMGFELGGIELGETANIDNVPFDRMREEILAQHERGGVTTISWHPFNPVTEKNAWDPSGNPVKEILPGGSQHQKFNKWLKIVADFLNSIQTVDGEKVPILFRPWHEMEGTWFWWGSKGTTVDEYKQLYIYTHDQLLKRYACDQLLWGYSPNSGGADYLKYYPGTQYVDLIGVDLYDFNKDNDVYIKNLKHDLEALKNIAITENKLVALTETGAQTLPDSTWFTHVFWPVAKEYPISYVLFWRNAWDNPKELYIAAPGLAVASDFKHFAKEKKTLFVKNIKKIK
jgi:mannan endo-1,4-beta-mannosidase